MLVNGITNTCCTMENTRTRTRRERYKTRVSEQNTAEYTSTNRLLVPDYCHQLTATIGTERVHAVVKTLAHTPPTYYTLYYST